LGRVLIIRAPRVFPILWTLVCPLIDETSRGKFLFYAAATDNSRGENLAFQSGGAGLHDYIPDQWIPDWLGGPANTGIPEGGLVPKSFYMTPQEFEKDQSPGPHLTDNSCYYSVSLNKGQVHEILIQNQDKGSVITWDFDVMRHDVVFSVFRTKERVKAKVTTPTTSGSLSVSSDPVHHTSIGRGWKEGSEYFRVETPIVCHDGESIQGSHVTQFVGSYILQWAYFERIVSGTAGQDMWDTITHPQHKARVMFYHEVLNSQDYKGSMTSLQSCQSGFSNFSKASTGQQSTSGISSGVSSNLSETTARNAELAES